jgi:hypothetical protein
MTKPSKPSKLTEDDKAMRQAIVNNEGKLQNAADDLDWSRWRIYNKLRAKKHRLWWLRTKQHFIRVRKRRREEKWKKNSRKNAVSGELYRTD